MCCVSSSSNSNLILFFFMNEISRRAKTAWVEFVVFYNHFTNFFLTLEQWRLHVKIGVYEHDRTTSKRFYAIYHKMQARRAKSEKKRNKSSRGSYTFFFLLLFLKQLFFAGSITTSDMEIHAGRVPCIIIF